MVWLLVGMIINAFDISINVHGYVVGILPDFIGYILLFKGFSILEHMSEKFMVNKKLSLIMIFYSIALYVMDFISIAKYIGDLYTVFFELVGIAFWLLITFNIVTAFEETEKAHQCNMFSKRMFRWWQLIAVFLVVHYLVVSFEQAALVTLIGAYVFSLLYLFHFWKGKKVYDNLNVIQKGDGEDEF